MLQSKLLIVISGPSGVGKRSILEAVALYSKLNLLKCPFNKVTLYNTRGKRNNEEDGIDYHYCYGELLINGRESIQANKRLIANEKELEGRLKFSKIEKPTNDLFTFPVRNDLQGIDLTDLKDGVNFLEIFDKFFDALQPKLEASIKVVRLFISPFTKNEIYDRAMRSQTDEASVITSEMNERIRARRRLGLSNEDEAEILKRTDSATREIQAAFTTKNNSYDAIIVNPCGEAHSGWGTSNTVPTGEARVVVETVCSIIQAQL